MLESFEKRVLEKLFPVDEVKTARKDTDAVVIVW